MPRKERDIDAGSVLSSLFVRFGKCIGGKSAQAVNVKMGQVTIVIRSRELPRATAESAWLAVPLSRWKRFLRQMDLRISEHVIRTPHSKTLAGRSGIWRNSCNAKR
jgi:hypothetical protein